MRIVNESGQPVYYGIETAESGDCGTIEVDGYVDLPFYDNQPSVNVSVAPTTGDFIFVINIPSTGTGEQVEMAFVAE